MCGGGYRNLGRVLVILSEWVISPRVLNDAWKGDLNNASERSGGLKGLF